MPASLLACSVLVALIGVGLGWPIAARLQLSPVERFVTAIVLSLVTTYLVTWGIYVTGLPIQAVWLLPAGAAIGIVSRRREFFALRHDAAARQLACAQLLVSAGCVIWLATVESYSGGGWAGDWFEHWERARFVLEGWPRDAKFLGQYPFTARPPFANVVMAAGLTLTRADFAHYQLLSTLFASLAFLPAALLAMRWGGVRAVSILAVFFLVSPLFIQNATFAWTKLPAAFFTLTAIHFFLRAREDGAPRTAATLCAASLAAGLLTHYSTGPYAVALAGAWFCIGWRRRHDSLWQGQTVLMVATGGALLATWFAWSIATYGVSGTLLTNSTFTSSDARQGNQLAKMGLNVFDTIVPHFLRSLDPSLIAQRSPWGYLRDWWFQNYQVNLFFAFGSVAGVALLRELARVARVKTPDRSLWLGLLMTIVLLGVAVHGQRDHWGLAHICLQALVLLGLAFLAARWTHLGRSWRLAIVVGAVVDFVLGIGLHFAVQSFALDRWLAAGRAIEETLTSYNGTALYNVQAKIHHQLTFLSNRLDEPFGLCLFAAILVVAVAILRTHTRPPPKFAPRAAADPNVDAGRPEDTPTAVPREHWLALIAVVAGVCAIAHLWFGWCAFPISTWNEARLAPAFAVRHGLPLYVPLGGGPLSTWIYGPVGVLVNLPATFAPSVVSAIETAGAINLLTLIVPLAAVALTAPELRRIGGIGRTIALAAIVLALPPQALAYQVADHTAIALGLLSCWVLTRQPVPASAACGVAAALCVASLWAKQVSVFVLVAQLLFLWSRTTRPAAWRYAAWAAGLGLLSLLINSAVFGFADLWLNVVAIPGRLPFADFSGKMLNEKSWLLGYVALPFALAFVLRACRCWPGRESASGRLLRCTLLVSLLLLPIGLLAFLKIGGATNALHAWYYLLAPLAIATVHGSWARRGGWAWLAAAAIALCCLRLPELRSLSTRPYTAHLVEAERIASAGGGTIWFPFNPLVTFYSDGKLYHDQDGIMTRSLAGFGLPPLDPRHLPSPLSAIVYNSLQADPLGLRLFQAYTHRTVVGRWAVYRPQPDAAK